MKYYKPDLVVEKPLKVQDSRVINVDVEKDVVIQRISKDLYANPTSGIRELYVNEARACREAIRQGYNAEIHVSIDQEKRSIVIEGRNSMGMSWDTFENVYCVLGRSTNFDGKESGQFGFGRAAYTCISDVMILDTWCRDTDEKYSVIGKSGVTFQTLPEPQMDSYGTRISMTAREDVGLVQIVRMVEKCAKLSGVKTVLTVDDGDSLQCEQKTLGEEITADIEDIFFKKLPKFTITTDDIDLVFQVRRYQGNHITMDSYLCGVPIAYSYKGDFRYMIETLSINIKDERKYRPTPDRERLSEESAKKVSERIDEMITNKAKEFAKDMTFDDYVENDCGVLVDLMLPFGHIECDETFYGMVRTRVHYTNGEYIIFGNTNHKKDVILAKTMKEVYKDKIKDVTIIRPEKKMYEKFKDAEFKTVEEYAKENNIRLTGTIYPLIYDFDRSERWRNRYYLKDSLKRNRVPENEIPENTIYLTKEELEEISFGEAYKCFFGESWHFTLDKRCVGMKNVITFDDFKEITKKKKCDTNVGEKTLEEIIQDGRDIIYYSLGDIEDLKPKEIFSNETLMIHNITNSALIRILGGEVDDCENVFDYLKNDIREMFPNFQHMKPIRNSLIIMNKAKTTECKDILKEYFKSGGDDPHYMIELEKEFDPNVTIGKPITDSDFKDIEKGLEEIGEYELLSTNNMKFLKQFTKSRTPALRDIILNMVTGTRVGTGDFMCDYHITNNEFLLKLESKLIEKHSDSIKVVDSIAPTFLLMSEYCKSFGLEEFAKTFISAELIGRAKSECGKKCMIEQYYTFGARQYELEIMLMMESAVLEDSERGDV